MDDTAKIFEFLEPTSEQSWKMRDIHEDSDLMAKT